MRIQENRIHHRGLQLHRLTISPETDIQGSLLFFHGQGDHIDRYPTILEPFLSAGFQCLLTDLPGHGRSEGKRGHIPDLSFIDSLTDETLRDLTGPKIIGGHSMGGLLALHTFLRPDLSWQAAWFSSPLLDPLRQASPMRRLFLPLIAHLAPSLTVSTGVKASACRHDASPPAEDEGPRLHHDLISLGWAKELVQLAEVIQSKFSNLEKAPPSLFTQGSADEICPLDILSERLQQLKGNQVTLEVIENGLHEPFVGTTAHQLQASLTDWLREEIII